MVGFSFVYVCLEIRYVEAMAMLRVTQGVIETWGRYERARAWGLRQEGSLCPAGEIKDFPIDPNVVWPGVSI